MAAGGSVGGGLGAEGFESQMWRALGVFRMLSLGYASLLFAWQAPRYTHPVAGVAAVAVMAILSAATVFAYRHPATRRVPVLAADLVVTAALVLASRFLDDPARVQAGAATLPTLWAAGAVLAWAIRGGPRAGAAAAAVMGAADVAHRGRLTEQTLHNIVMLILAGSVIGYVCRLARVGEAQLTQALLVQARYAERERLARRIHDSVLQVLALVQRRGTEIGGAAAELGRLAGEQEFALRALVADGLGCWVGQTDGENRTDGADGAAGSGGTAPELGATRDLCPILRGLGSTRVTVSVPATPVLLAPPVVDELAAAVGAALNNVARHAGAQARAWVLVEEDPAAVVVSIRDDGSGIPAGRLAAAAAEGRLGVAQSIQGRLRHLGGVAVVDSAPGRGTDVELRLPRAGAGNPARGEDPAGAGNPAGSGDSAGSGDRVTVHGGAGGG